MDIGGGVTRRTKWRCVDYCGRDYGVSFPVSSPAVVTILKTGGVAGFEPATPRVPNVARWQPRLVCFAGGHIRSARRALHFNVEGGQKPLIKGLVRVAPT